MPFRTKTLAGANAAALAEEMRAELDAALTAHPAWTKVTSAYAVSAAWTFDVWQNNGTADGYGWFLVVGKSKTTAHCLMGGMLEYDPATFIAKKALRGYNTPAFVNSDGWATVGAGGAEQTFPLQAFTNTLTYNVANLGASSGSLPATPVVGHWVRTLVTDRVAWQAYGTPTTHVWAHGVGTYLNAHSLTADQRPLAFMATPASLGPTTVWQHPGATDGTGSRASIQWAAVTFWENGAVSQLYGEVGGNLDLLRGAVIGSRLAVQRTGTNTKSTTTTSTTAGGFLGLVPDDFLTFDRASGCAIGDTITVNGKIYVSVDTPSAVSGLFVNTQPAI